MKNIWIIAAGEPLPIDKNQRLHRAGILSEILVSRGHNVTWWTSTVDHYNKILFHPNDGEIKLDSGLKLKFLHGGLYKKNISIQRILNHIRIAKKFTKQASTENKPDVIVVSYPTIELSLAAVEYGKRHKIPVLVDFRDLWPDIFYEAVPSKLRWLIFPLIHYYNKQIKKIVDGSGSVIGITEEFKKWAILKGSNRGKNSKVFHLSYKAENSSKKGVKKPYLPSTDIFRICFFGTFSKRLDLETLYQAAEKLKNDRVEFVLCGQITLELQERINKNLLPSNIKFPGHVGLTQMRKIADQSHMGVLPYAADDFKMSIPNKVGEYLSGELPILYCLEGATDALLEENNCGIYYKTENVKDLVDKILYIKDNNKTLNKMRFNALNTYNNHLNADMVYGAYCDYIENMSNYTET